jgi:membrane-associated protease RseP (regulator of RpoE activity)
VIAVFLALVLFAVGNALGTGLLKTSGFGLISLSRSTSPGRWRAPAARFAGPLLIYLAAAAAFAVANRFSEVATTQIQVAPGLPADAAGLRNGDRVVEMNGAPVSVFPDVVERVREVGPGKPVEMVVARGEQRLTVKPVTDAEGHIGVRPSGELMERSWGEAIAGSLGMPFRAGVSWWRKLWVGATSEHMELLGGPIAVRQVGSFSSRVPVLLWPLAASLSGSGILLALAALAFQVVAWARGELRAPTPGGG